MAETSIVLFTVEMPKNWLMKSKQSKQSKVKPTPEEIKQLGFRNATEERNAKLLIAQAKHEENRRRWRAEMNAKRIADAEKAAKDSQAAVEK